MRIQADHLLRGYEAVATRLMQTVAVAVPAERVDAALARAIVRDGEELPEAARQLRRRFPDEPYRQRFGAIAERLRRTRAGLAAQPGPAPVAIPAWMRWTSSCARSRRHSSRTALAASRGATSPTCAGSWHVRVPSRLARGPPARGGPRAALAALDSGATATTEVAPGVALGEVMASFRAMARLQARFGETACHRYVVHSRPARTTC